MFNLDTAYVSTHKIKYTVYLFIVLFVMFITLQQQAYAGRIPEKTPADVYHLTLILAKHVDKSRQNDGIKTPWPLVPPQSGKKPRHLMQKSLEVLAKINRLRVNAKLGEISIPPYPARHITNDDVFDTVARLVDEMKLLIELKGGDFLDDQLLNQQKAKVLDANDVYQNLWAISLAIDPALGVRGFTPADVYAQSQHILQLVHFLRQTQNLPINIKKPKITNGKHSNHALKSAYKLLAKISQAEKNLWISATEVPKIEKKVITPTKVFDALQNVIAELQRIKFRLGVERHFSTPQVQPGKTPDDVIQNLEWATLLMPIFPLNIPLRQQDPASLIKTPDDVYAATLHSLKELEQYRAKLGIRSKQKQPPQLTELQPKHVYQKSMHVLHKVDQLRKLNGLGGLATPRYPLRAITPAEVYEMVIRIDFEMEIIYRHAGLKDTQFYLSIVKPVETQNKTPSDVYENIWKFSQLIDSILGTDSYDPTDIYRQTSQILSELNLIIKRLDYRNQIQLPQYQEKAELEDLLLYSKNILKLLHKVQKRAGINSKIPPIPQTEKNITAIDVFNIVNVVHAELVSLKLFFGITQRDVPATVMAERTLGDSLQLLQLTHMILLNLLSHENINEGEKS
ncbi:MAG: hypothetical protein HQL68_05315 [Magnetococcales bacterium]|nr:hypothetical protein [Magnetococcales bacterium]